MLQINQLSFWEKQSFFEEIDFVVIGAGIVGYSAAINLKRCGFRLFWKSNRNF
jgi:monoamine oxidase